MAKASALQFVLIYSSFEVFLNIKNLVIELELQAPECEALYGPSCRKEPCPMELHSQDVNHRNKEK